MTVKKRADGRLRRKIAIGDGTFKYCYAYSEKELEKKVAEIKIRIGKGIDVSAERDTFSDWASRWLAMKKPSISDGRFKSYQYRIEKMESISRIPIIKLTVSDCQNVINEAFENDAALKTLKEYKSVISQICQYAIINRVMDFNPASGIVFPKYDDEPEERRALTIEEQSFITAPSEHRAHIAAMIMLYAGLRRGELLALTWNDIDFDNKTIRVNKSVKMVDGRPIVKNTTKTTAGKRVVNVPQLLIDYLEGEREHASSLLVVPNTDGELNSGSSWRKLWDSYLKELNFRFGDFDKQIGFKKPRSRFAPVAIPFVLDRFTAHNLRHTFITNMYLAGVDVVTASRQAGHADIQTTIDIYTHLDDEFKRVQMDKLDDFYSKHKIV